MRGIKARAFLVLSTLLVILFFNIVTLGLSAKNAKDKNIAQSSTISSGGTSFSEDIATKGTTTSTGASKTQEKTPSAQKNAPSSSATAPKQDKSGTTYENQDNYYKNSNSAVAAESSSRVDTASLLPEGGKVDTSELSEDDWKLVIDEIRPEEADVGDFSFIKNSTASSSYLYDSWMLYAGIALIALAVAGIAYVIFSSIMYNKCKKLKMRENNATRLKISCAKISNDEFEDIYSSSAPPQNRRPDGSDWDKFFPG